MGSSQENQQARVSLHYSTSFGGRRANLEIECDRSRAKVRVSLSMEELANLISGLVHRPAIVEKVSDLEHWGQQAEIKLVSLAVKLWELKEEDEMRLVAEHCPEGYEIRGRSRTNQGTLDICYIRWKVPEETA